MKPRSAVAAVALLSALAATTRARPASAQTAGEKAAAERLFEDAMALMDQKDYGHACPKFAESLHLDAGIGVTLHLADCYEHLGKVASAWATFREADEMATREGDAHRAELAHRHAAALEPSLSTLTISVAAPAEGLVVRRDGVDVGRAQWGVAIPVDPGPHAVAAVAPGRARWETTANVSGARASVTVEVPKLELDAGATAGGAVGSTDGAAASVPPPPPAARASSSAPATDHVATPSAPSSSPSSSALPTQRIVAIGVAGAGAVALGLGAFFGLEASSHFSDSNAGGNCIGDHCTPAGTAARNDALSAATASTIAFVAGGVALAAGAVLWLTTPRPHAPSVGVTGASTGQASSILVIGTF